MDDYNKQGVPRDYELERDELLQIVAKVIPPEVRDAIEISAKHAQSLPVEQAVAEVSFEGSHADA